MANVMIAGGNPDVYYELMLTTTSEACAGRDDGSGDASDEREQRGSWGSGEMTAGDSGEGAARSSADGGEGMSLSDERGRDERGV